MFAKLFQAIDHRKSVRDFSAKPVPVSLLSELEDFVKAIPSLGKKKVQMKLIKNDRELLTSSLLTPIGTFMANAPYFFAVSAQDDMESLIEAGYQTEYLVLNLVAHHLGSCYIGGFLNFAYLEKKLRIPAPEKLLVILPFGFPSATLLGLWTHSVIEAGKMLMGESGRKSLHEFVFYKQWEQNAQEYLKSLPVLQHIFEKTRVAPSGANLQPWRFVITPQGIYAFSISTLKGKLVGNENLWGKDYRNYDLGIALAHFEIAARELNYAGSWDLKTGLTKKELEELNIPAAASFIARWS